MCGRYTLTTNADLIVDRFGVPEPPQEALGRWNVAPTEAMAVVTKPGDVSAARWGLLPYWARKLDDRPAPINARSEGAATNGLFKRLIASDKGRCLILADGWYEWLRPENKKLKPTPFRYTVDGGAPFAFAGLYADRRIGGEDGADDVPRVRCATILTTAANDLAARVHDRMPVVLPGPDEEAAWLSGELDADGAVELCVPLSSARCHVQAVSSRVNRAGTGDEGPHLLEPDPPTQLEPPPQSSLF